MWAARPLAVSKLSCCAIKTPCAARLQSQADLRYAESKAGKDPEHELKCIHASSRASQSEAVAATIFCAPREEQNAEHQNSIRVESSFRNVTISPGAFAMSVNPVWCSLNAVT